MLRPIRKYEAGFDFAWGGRGRRGHHLLKIIPSSGTHFLYDMATAIERKKYSPDTRNELKFMEELVVRSLNCLRESFIR